MAAGTVKSNRVAKPLKSQTDLLTAAIQAPVSGGKPVAQTGKTTAAAGSLGSIVAPSLDLQQVPGDNAAALLPQIISKYGPADPASIEAQKLIDALKNNPALGQDPKFREAVQSTYNASNIIHGPLKGTAAAKDALSKLQKGVNGFVSGEATKAAQTTQDNANKRILDIAEKSKADNEAFVDKNLTPLLGQQRNAAGAAKEMDLETQRQQTAARDKANARDDSLVNEARALSTNYNGQATNAFNAYQGQQNALNSQDQGNLQRYMGETDPLMQQLQARTSDPNDLAAQQAALQRAVGISGGSLDYQAAQARSNAGDVARQSNSYNQLQGVGAGSLDYNARQYTSNGEDVAGQQEALRRFNQIGGGSLNYDSNAQDARASDIDIQNQRNALTAVQNDRLIGDKDQRDAYNTIKGRTGVEATAQEALLAEQARRKFEGDDSSRRAAVMEDQAQRGLRSGSAEIANMVLGQQQTAQDRQMAEMNLQANAIGRAQQYTGMQADQANAMRNSSQQGLGIESQLSTNMRNAGFDEEYKRGVAHDSAARDNQGTKLAGYQLAGNQANANRSASDSVGTFNTGQQNNALANNQQTRFSGYNSAAGVATSMRNASDSMAVNNAGFTNQALANNQSTRMSGATLQANQSNQIRSANDAQRQYEDTYSANEATRVGNLAGQRANTNLATTAQTGGRNAQTYGDQAQMIQSNYGRDADPINMANQQTPGQYQRDSDVAALPGQIGQRAFDRTGTMIGSGSTVAQTRSGTSSDANRDLVAALRNTVGASVYAQDEKALGGGY